MLVFAYTMSPYWIEGLISFNNGYLQRRYNSLTDVLKNFDKSATIQALTGCWNGRYSMYSKTKQSKLGRGNKLYYSWFWHKCSHTIMQTVAIHVMFTRIRLTLTKKWGFYLSSYVKVSLKGRFLSKATYMGILQWWCNVNIMEWGKKQQPVVH